VVERPDCCEAMRRELALDQQHIVSFCPLIRAPLEDVDGSPIAGDEPPATWLNDQEPYGCGLRRVRIRFCPWCGAEIDSREKL
jgi:hypothetical protein